MSERPSGSWVDRHRPPPEQRGPVERIGGRRRIPSPDTPTLWASGPGSARDRAERTVASGMKSGEVRRYARIVGIIKHGQCTATFRGKLPCRLKRGHERNPDGTPGTRHEANANLNWAPIPAPSCSCDDFTPCTDDDGLVLGCSECGEIVWPWPPRDRLEPDTTHP